MKRTMKSAKPKKTARKSKGSKRDREDDDSQDDTGSAAIKKLAFPPKGSIQAVFLEKPPVQPFFYQEWLAAGYLSFSSLPWDIIRNNILVYLDYMDTRALARTTRQWYCRIAAVACSKFAVFLRVEFEKDFSEREKKLADSHPNQKWEKWEFNDRRVLRCLEETFQRLTPLAISYFSSIGKVVWDKRCLVRTRLTEKSKKWDRQRITTDALRMLRNIKEHGNLDSYKAHMLANTTRLDALFKVDADRVQRVFRLFEIILIDLNYKPAFKIDIRYNSCQIRFKPNFYADVWGNDSQDEKDRKLRLNALYNTLRHGEESDLRALDIKAVLYILVSDKLVAKI